MTSRKFTVFIDDVSTVKPPKPASTKVAQEEAGPSSLSATEKENLHPLTGGRLRSSTTVGLKRKSSVLSTKLHNPPNAKNPKQTPSLAPSKKRKVSSSSDGETERSRPKTRRLKPTTRRGRSPELASIAEEKDERLARRLSQSDVDSRCYDLTVSPLVNVSSASAQPSALEDSKTKATTEKVRWIFLMLPKVAPSSKCCFRLVPPNQNSEIMFAPLQTQLPQSLPLPPSAVQPVEPPSLLQLCPPRRGSEFMLPSPFHPRFGDLPNANANALPPPRLETCRRYPNLRFLLCGPRPELQLRPAGPQMNRVTLIDASCHQRCCRGPMPPHVLSTSLCDNPAVTNWTTRTIYHLHAHSHFHSHPRFLHLFTDPQSNLLLAFCIDCCNSHFPFSDPRSHALYI